MNILASAFIKVDRQSSQSIAGQITEQIRAKILSGILKKGDSLPSSRLLSQALGCSRNTVIAAYQALSLEGLIETRQGLGTIVASESTMLPHKPEIIDTLKSRQGPLGERKLSNRALVAQSLGKVRTQELIPFALAYPSHQEVPPREWYSEPARLFKSTWAHMSYEFPSDSRSLSMCLCDYVRRTRGIVCEPEQIVITDNFWQGTVLACQLLFEPGDAVILTDPCRYRHRELLEFMNLQPLFVKLDENGLDWQMLENAMQKARGIILSPSELFPFGSRLDFTERTRVLKLAQQYNVWLIEKDNGKEFFTAATWFPAIFSLDEADSVVYIDSFTRMLYPGINVGFLIVPKWMAQAARGVKYLSDIQTPKPSQQLVRHAIESGFLDKCSRRGRTITRDIRQRLAGRLNSALSSYGHLYVPKDAPYILLIVNESIDDMKLCSFLREKHHIESRALSETYAKNSMRKGLLLGFAGMQPEDIQQAVDKLAVAIGEFIGRP